MVEITLANRLFEFDLNPGCKVAEVHSSTYLSHRRSNEIKMTFSAGNYNGTYDIVYHFNFDDGNAKTFKIVIDQASMTCIIPEIRSKPDWAKLSHHQCAECRLEATAYSWCPIAMNISDIVETFKDILSIAVGTIRCVTPERTYVKETSLQEGLFSIIGLINATSECPVMSFFRPMARFHLPFSTLQETLARITSFYLLGQYFRHIEGQSMDLDLVLLEEHYGRVQMVNMGMIERIKGLTKKDANQNAYIILNSMAQLMSMEIDDSLDSLKYLFQFGS